MKIHLDALKRINDIMDEHPPSLKKEIIDSLTEQPYLLELRYGTLLDMSIYKIIPDMEVFTIVNFLKKGVIKDKE